MTWQQACSNARQTLKSTASMLLEKYCLELFAICESLSALADEADENCSDTVARGLYAASYRLAGAAKIIVDAAVTVLSVVDEPGANRGSGATATDSLKFRFLASASAYQPLLEKLEEYQNAIEDFASSLKKDCSSELMHLGSEIMLILEHPFALADESFQNRLRERHEAVASYSELLYELGSQLESHPVLKIDAAMFDGAMH
ncbi:MAG: hypothetical protein ACU841_14810 [Gammaproteobacteria bacterium]